MAKLHQPLALLVARIIWSREDQGEVWWAVRELIPADGKLEACEWRGWNSGGNIREKKYRRHHGSGSFNWGETSERSKSLCLHLLVREELH